MKVIISPEHMFSLNRPTLEALFKRRPEVFDEGIDAEVMRLPGHTDAQMLAWSTTAVLRNGVLYYLKEKSPELRTDSELVALIESQGSSSIQEYGRDYLKVVEIPDNIQWYIRTEDDGSESIHEAHRIWR